MDLGLEVAGFRTVSALDSDASCIATLRANQKKGIAIPGGQDRFLSGTTILQKAIEDTSAKDLFPHRAAAGWRPDLLAGGPPCQPFSSAGKQLALNDPRGRLFEHFVRLAAELQPRLVVFENVRGLVTAPGPSGEPGEALALVRAEFERIGYATSFALLNAADYGVPQRRVRLFMLGTTRAPIPLFPEPTHAEAGGASLLFGVRKTWITLGEFLANHGAPREEDVERPSTRLAALLEGVRAGSGLKSPGAREATRPGGHWGVCVGSHGQSARASRVFRRNGSSSAGRPAGSARSGTPCPLRSVSW
jgi:DNA (cytosine-5)-methyltransferase 1